MASASLIDTFTDLIETRLKELFAQESTTGQAARYALFSGGKRLRPLLTLATATAYDAPLQQALDPACALECVHTYSLIHDDLPCMDDDDLRRGKPTLHKVYSEGHAVLTGDFLLTYAFEILSCAPHLSAEQKIKLIQLLSSSAGAEGMIGGQVTDIAIEGKQTTWPVLEKVYFQKTAALLSAAVLFGGIVGRAPENDYRCLQRFGEDIGMAFQIVDDILDAGGSDHTKAKPTAVLLLGIDGAKAHVDKLFASATSALSKLSVPTPLLNLLASKLIHRQT